MTWPRQCVVCDHLIYPSTWMFALNWSHAGRGLCTPCYARAHCRDELIDLERTNRTRDEVMAEWEILRGEGYSKKQAAERLGMTFAAFDRAFHRARRDGDPRAFTLGPKARSA